MANETAAEAAKPKPAKLKKAANGANKGTRLLAYIRAKQKEGWEPFIRKGHHGHFEPIDLDKI